MNIFAKTDESFYKEHPELDGRPLTLKPEDKALRQEYMSMYNANKKSATKDSKNAPGKPAKCVHPDAADHVNKKNENKKCTASSIEIVKKGGYKLKIPGTNLLYKNVNYKDCSTLEIVAGPPQKPATVSITASGLAGPCADVHLNKAFNYNEHDLSVISKTDSDLELKSASIDFRQGSTFSSFKEILKYIFLDQSLDYNIAYNLCGCDYSLTLKVFPDLSAVASVSINYEWNFSKKGKQLTKDDSDNKKLEDKLKYSFEIKHSDISIFKLDSSKRDTEVGFWKFLTCIGDNLDYLSKGLSVFLGESQTLKIAINPSLSGTCALKEVAGKPFVDTYYKIQIGFSPLLQIDADADVSGELLLLIPVIGEFLAAAVAAAESAKLGDVFIGFKISGKIDLQSNFERQAGDADVTQKLSFNCNIKITLLGKVSTDLHIWKFHYAAGAEVGAQSGFKVDDSFLMDDEQGIYFPLKITFLGIVLFWQTWQNKGVDLGSSDVPRVAKMQNALGSNTQEIDDLENLPDNNKKTVVDPSEIYNDKLYIL